MEFSWIQVTVDVFFPFLCVENLQHVKVGGVGRYSELGDTGGRLRNDEMNFSAATHGQHQFSSTLEEDLSVFLPVACERSTKLGCVLPTGKQVQMLLLHRFCQV